MWLDGLKVVKIIQTNVGVSLGGKWAALMHIEAIFHEIWIVIQRSSLSHGKKCTPSVLHMENPKQQVWRDEQLVRL